MDVGIAKIGGMMQKRKSRQRVFSVAVAFLMLVMSASAVAQQAPLQVPSNEVDGFDRGPRTYIVMMSEEPAGAYRGGTAGFAATRPAPGTRLDVTAPHVSAYRDHLRGRHDAALASVGGASKIYDYGVAFNGFAAVLTGAQAALLARNPGVVAIFENERQLLDTMSTPDFLGLSDPGGAWAQRFLGDSMVIGVVDSGIRPESLSFAETSAGRPDGTGSFTFGSLGRFHGICQTGELFDADDCSNKLVGARFYHAGFGTAAELKETIPYEYVSPLDVDGHGTHTSSTAGGNWGVPVEVNGEVIGHISGMAPRARIAMYKACWGFGEDPEAGCFNVDTVAAIDQAVADGVDVINFSISGTSDNFLDPVEVAFLFAADAGVFVAASAGNDGPGAATANHPSPWLTTVAAGTHDRTFTANLTLGNGAVYSGASLQPTGTPSLPMVYSGSIPAAGATAADAALCFPGSIDPAQAAGKMVVCDRGVSPRVEKSQVVADAGGLAMVLVNVTPNSLNADIHAVPTIHVDDVAGAAIKTYVAGANPTGSLSPGVQGVDPTAPAVADFSSRGPTTGDILKPDITAPGVDVLAAYSPDHGGHTFDFLSGTSMASPHVAGIAAVIMSAHRDWTPAMVKSALMTTAADIRRFGPFDEGSGQVTPNSALRPGLVYDADFNDYFGFLCGTGQLASPGCASLEIDPSDLNTPNISIGDLAGSQTVTRTVTNVGASATFTAKVAAPQGVTVTVSPTSLAIPSGQSGTFTVTFTRTTAPLGQFSFGTLTWIAGQTRVRSVLAVRPVQLAAPGEVFGSGTTGSVAYDIAFGYTGAFTAAPHGLVAPTTTPGTVVDDPANNINTALASGVGITTHLVNVPAGTALARFSLFDEFTDGADDLDLYVFGPGPGFPFAGGSGTATSEEQVDLIAPPAGDYIVVVHGFETDGPDSNYTLFDWLVSSTPADGSGATDLTITAPGAAVLGTSGTVTVNWDGLAADQKYLGGVSYNDGTGQIGFTTVTVNTD
jgi:subtilisin family serine protease